MRDPQQGDRARIEAHRRTVPATLAGIVVFWAAGLSPAGLGIWWGWHEWGRLLLALREALA